MSIGTIILIILVIALLGGFSGIGGGPFYGTGYYGGGGLGLIIVVLLILLLLGKLGDRSAKTNVRIYCGYKNAPDRRHVDPEFFVIIACSQASSSPA